MIDDIDSTVHNIYDDFLKYKCIIPNKLDKIRSMNFDILNKIKDRIDFNNKAVVKMVPCKKD